MKYSAAVVNALTWMVLGTPVGARLVERGNDKLDGVLYDIVKQATEGGIEATEIKFPENMLVLSDDMPIVEIRGTEADNEKIIALVEAFGGIVTGCFRLLPGCCSAAIPLNNLNAFAKEGPVRSVSSNFAIFNAGSVTSEASQAMEADVARTLFNITGRGVKVGILSDSYDISTSAVTSAADGILSGDLPPPDRIHIVKEGPVGRDEGRGIMELIHDVAPGADLAFLSSNFGLAAFADGIIELVNIGCDIIVDDVIYLAESMFQDDLPAQAVDYANDRGVQYFASGGNQGRNSYDGPFVETDLTIPAGSFSVAEFPDPENEGATLPYLEVSLREGTNVVLQWDDPKVYAPDMGLPGPTRDIDLLLCDEAFNIVRLSARTNSITGLPVEIVRAPFSGTFRLVFVLFSDDSPNFFKVVFFGGSDISPLLTASASYGHANAKGAIAVGAAPYTLTPGFGVSPAIQEPFSSAGGTPIFFDTLGQRLFKEEVRVKPEITSVDGTCTSFFGSFNVFGTGCFNFFGTSASAPNAAAVAALMLEVQPRLQPENIRDIMIRSSEDMDDTFTPNYDFGFDFGTGAGFLNALYAVGFAALPLHDINLGKGGKGRKGGKDGKSGPGGKSGKGKSGKKKSGRNLEEDLSVGGIIEEWKNRNILHHGIDESTLNHIARKVATIRQREKNADTSSDPPKRDEAKSERQTTDFKQSKNIRGAF
eukprot:scaffold34616_cov275-Amphora_coffeaeformis.AAC.2